MLELKAAHEGRDTPPHILTEIVDLQEKITDIDEQLGGGTRLSHRSSVKQKWVWSATQLQHKVGKKLSEHEWGASVPSEQNHLVYGQYIDLSPDGTRQPGILTIVGSFAS